MSVASRWLWVSCKTVALLASLVVGPLNFLVWHRPENIGLNLAGISAAEGFTDARKASNIVDPHWASIEWTLVRALGTKRFWWIVIGYFCALFAWYAVQVHQTKYLTEVGFPPLEAAWALGAVSVAAIPGQIGLGALSDRIGREWIWSAGCLGFAICYVALILMEHQPSSFLLYVMVVSQGSIGYALTSVVGPIVVEIFEGPHYGTIFGAVTIALIGGGAAGRALFMMGMPPTGSLSSLPFSAVSYRLLQSGSLHHARCALSRADRRATDIHRTAWNALR
jgi:sugar phosphate permease